VAVTTATLAGIITEPPDPIELVVLRIAIAAPLNGASLTGPATGQPITVSGTLTLARITLANVAVDVSLGDATGPAAISTDAAGNVVWSAAGRATAPGPLVITARARTISGTARSAQDSITVDIPDTVPPYDLTIVSPATGALVDVSEQGETVVLEVVARDHLGVGSVQCRLGNGTNAPLTRDAVDPARWRAAIPLPGSPVGLQTLTVRCVDLRGNPLEKVVTFTTRDRTPPTYEILEPAENAKLPRGRVTLRGTARDGQSGLAALQYSLNGKDFLTLDSVDVGRTWS